MNLKKNVNRQYMQISIYVIATAVIIYSLSLVAKSAPVILGEILGWVTTIYRIAKPVVIGFVIAYLLEGMVSFFEKKLSNLKWLNQSKSHRGVAVLITVVLVLAIFMSIISTLVYSLTNQIRFASLDDIVTLINQYSQSINDLIGQITIKLSELNVESQEIKEVLNTMSGYLLEIGTNVINGAVGSVSSITASVTTGFFSIIIAIYFLIDGKLIKGNLNKISIALFSDKFNKLVRGFLKDADFVFSGYIKGQLMDAIVMMVLISVSLSLVGVKFAVLIGVFAGIGNLIPYCGPFIAYGSSIIVCLLDGDMRRLIISVIVLLVIQTIDGNIIGPKLLSHSIQVHPLLVIISLIFGSAIGGLFGMLLAVPVGALLVLIFMRYIDSRIAYKESLKKVESKEK